MILRTELVEQKVDTGRSATLEKDVLMTQGLPLGMLRKHRPGGGPTKGAVILIHGFAQNRYTWHSSARSFSAYLADEGWDVFVAELRGHGRSRHYSHLRPTMLDDHVREDFPAFVREAVALSGHDQIFLVGHSMGGLLSYASAATSVRERVAGVITLGSPYRFGAGNAALVGLGKLVDVVHYTGLLDGRPMLPTNLAGKLFRWIRPVHDRPRFPLPLRGWKPGSIEYPALDEFLDRSFEAVNVRVTADLMYGGERHTVGSRTGQLDYAAAWRALDVPLLVVAGEEDALAPPAAVKRAYDDSGSRDKTYRVFPLGHVDLVLGIEAPGTTWPLIRDWLERHRS